MVNTTINTTLLFNGTSPIGDMVSFVNQASGGFFSLGLLITIFMITFFVSFRRSDVASSLTVAGLISFMASAFLLMAGATSLIVSAAFLLITALGLWMLSATKQ